MIPKNKGTIDKIARKDAENVVLILMMYERSKDSSELINSVFTFLSSIDQKGDRSVYESAIGYIATFVRLDSPVFNLNYHNTYL